MSNNVAEHGMPTRFRFYTIAAAVLLGLTGTPVSGQSQPLPAGSDALTLRPGDLLKVEVWREPDLSGVFTIDETGIVTLPMLGEREVTGAPMREVRNQLIAEYRVQLNNPSILITPLRRVHVLGYVNQPGTFNADPTLSLAGVIALAGGANAGGDLDKITIVRQGATLTETAAIETSLIDGDVRSGDQIFVGRRGWFERNTTFIISALLSATSLIISLSR